MKRIKAAAERVRNMVSQNSEKKNRVQLNMDKIFKLLLFLALAVLITIMFPQGRTPQFADMVEGSISTRRIVAPFSFEILKTESEYQADIKKAVEKVHPVFLRKSLFPEIQKDVDDFFSAIYSIRYQYSKNRQEASARMDSLAVHYPIAGSGDKFWSRLLQVDTGYKKRELDLLQQNVKGILRDMLAVGVLSIQKEQFEDPDKYMLIMSRGTEKRYTVSDFSDMSEALPKALERITEVYPDRQDIARTGYTVLSYFLRPNLIYLKKLHEERIEQARATVPRSSGFVYKNEKIVDRNERITSDIRKRLVSLATVTAEKRREEGGIKTVTPFVGKLFFVVALLVIFVLFIQYNRPDVFENIKLMILVALIILLVSVITFVIHKLNASEYLVPTALGAMLLTTLFDLNVGFIATAVLSLLLGGIWGNEFNFTVMAFFTSVVGVLTIKRIRGRRQLVLVILYLIGAYGFSMVSMGFLRAIDYKIILNQVPYGAFTALITPIVAYGILPLIELVFGVTTDFSLLELSDLNHHLLKKLSVEAPGTYYHSINVGNLAESAAQAIGANSLLARVGSYYHDIGKIEKAEYFIENQLGTKNPHEKLAPRMSALILSNHVKRGLELSDENKLPKRVRDIISQHQGTGLMNFFYNKAEKEQKDGLSEEDYRYSGPRPQSKEAAIVMLADAVEAASRSLKDPSHSRLKGLVGKIVDDKFKEGELDESPLTLRDLEKIKDGFLNILSGMYHTRVEYPSKAEKSKGGA